MVNSGVEWNVQVVSYKAGADLSTFRNQFVKLDVNGDVVPVTATTDRAIGVLRDPYGVGEVVGVWQADGVAPVKVSASGIAANDLIGVSANGRAVKLVAGTDTTKYIHGVAQEASTAADEVISVQLVLPTTTA